MLACSCNNGPGVWGLVTCLTKRWEVTRLPSLTSEGNRRMFVDEHLAAAMSLFVVCLFLGFFWPTGHG